jgi:hypothetical protein
MMPDLEHVGGERDAGGKEGVLDLLPGISGQEHARSAGGDAHHDRSLILFRRR